MCVHARELLCICIFDVCMWASLCRMEMFASSQRYSASVVPAHFALMYVFVCSLVCLRVICHHTCVTAPSVFLIRCIVHTHYIFHTSPRRAVAVYVTGLDRPLFYEKWSINILNSIRNICWMPLQWLLGATKTSTSKQHMATCSQKWQYATDNEVIH